MNPDPNLMAPRCPHGDFFKCPEDFDPVALVCPRCGLPAQAKPELSEASKAQIANILTAPERGLDMVAAGDMVNLPHHYARFPIEPIRFIVENKLDWFQGNILKYLLRYDDKNGMEDVDKGLRYFEMYKKYLAGDPDWWKRPQEAGRPGHVER